jgi:hypothetical protein
VLGDGGCNGCNLDVEPCGGISLALMCDFFLQDLSSHGKQRTFPSNRPTTEIVVQFELTLVVREARMQGHRR